jgi:hypothetical protein
MTRAVTWPVLGNVEAIFDSWMEGILRTSLRRLRRGFLAISDLREVEEGHDIVLCWLRSRFVENDRNACFCCTVVDIDCEREENGRFGTVSLPSRDVLESVKEDD